MVITLLILVIAIITRLSFIGILPQGLHCDEASAIYEAYSIGRCLMDRNGKILPCMLIDFGSGKSPLYTYILIPIVKLFGVNIYTTRVPMAIISIISFVFVAFLSKKIIIDTIEFQDDKARKWFYYFSIFFLAINPYLIMKSRFGLEVNLLPEIFIIAFILLYYYLIEKKNKYLILSSIFIGLSCYAYSTSFVFMPIFLILLTIMLATLKHKKIIDFENNAFLISGLIIFVIVLPLILYVFINFFDLNEISLPFLTIPRLSDNRMSNESLLKSDNAILQIFINIYNLFKIMILQDDGLRWNSVGLFGMTYLISIPFMLIGLFYSIKKYFYKDELIEDNDKKNNVLILEYMVDIYLLSVVTFSMTLYKVNINRVNIVIYPLIYYILKGIYVVFIKINKTIRSKDTLNVNNIVLLLKQHVKFYFTILVVIYMISFVSFVNKYKNITVNDEPIFRCDLENVVKYTLDYPDYDIYFDYTIKEPAIKIAFYLAQYEKLDPVDYIKTVKYRKGYPEFDGTIGFKNWHFVDYMMMYKNMNKFIYITNDKKNSIIQSGKYDYIKIDGYSIVKFGS